MDATAGPHHAGGDARDSAVSAFAGVIERPLLLVLEWIAGLLVLAEVVILLMGVVARSYVEVSSVTVPSSVMNWASPYAVTRS